MIDLKKLDNLTGKELEDYLNTIVTYWEERLIVHNELLKNHIIEHEPGDYKLIGNIIYLNTKLPFVKPKETVTDLPYPRNE